MLEALLNEGGPDGKFTGTRPEGSNSRYAVEGTGNELRLRLQETTRYGTDQFRIVSEEYLRSAAAQREFPGQYDPLLLRSVNHLLGVTTTSLWFGNESVNLSGVYLGNEAILTRTHADGRYELAGSNTELRLVGDGTVGRYQAVNSAGVPLRHFTIAEDKSVIADEYMLALGTWSDSLGQIVNVTANRTTPPSMVISGTWTRKAADGGDGTPMAPVTIDHNGSTFTMNLPEELHNAVGAWTRTGLDSKDWTADSTATHGYKYTGAEGTRYIQFLEWDGMDVVRFREQRPNLQSNVSYFFAWNGSEFEEESGAFSWSWQPPAGFRARGAFPSAAQLSVDPSGPTVTLQTTDLQGNVRASHQLPFSPGTDELTVGYQNELWTADWQVYGRISNMRPSRVVCPSSASMSRGTSLLGTGTMELSLKTARF